MIKKLLSVVILIFVSVLVLAQDRPKPYQIDLDRANDAFANKRYNTAAQFYQKVYPKVKDTEEKQYVLFRIAESYRYSNNFKQAIKWFEEVLNARYPDPKVIYSYGLLLKNFERYDEAGRAFYDYLFEAPTDKEAKREMESCKIAATWKANPLKFNITNIKDVNTEYSDYAPFLVDKKLYLTSSRKETTGKEIFEWTGQKYSDIFESDFGSNNFAKPEIVKGKINTNFNEGAAWIDSLNTTMYYTQCNGIGGDNANCKIFVSYNQNGLWTEGKALPFNNDSFSFGHPSMNLTGDKLFFASNLEGGFGGKDIWYVNYNAAKDVWSEPINCGSLVNTTQDDMFPFVGDSNKLYFSSKGHIGMGGFDVYVTVDSANTFAKPVNLKYPINSGADDIGFTLLPTQKQVLGEPIGFISSNREGGLGDDDIYSITVKPFLFLVKGTVLDRETKQTINAANILVTQEDGSFTNLKTTDKGTFSAEMKLNTITQIAANKDKYFNSGNISINTNGIYKDSVLELTIWLDLIPAEDVEITLKGIYYDLDKADLRPDAKRVLDSLIIVLNANPGLVIEIASHTDSRAPADYNLDLSKRRAKSCVDYLVTKGIDKKRLVSVGYGETKLVNDCSDDVDCTEEEHQQNRRTTFRVLKSDYKK